MNAKKTLIVLSLAMTTYCAMAESVVCTTNPDFAKNSCDVCFSGGDATVSSKEITLLKEQKLPWKNDTDNLNHIFYRDGQKARELITEYGTTPAIWVGADISWEKDFAWGDTDGQKTYSLAMGKEVTLADIAKNTKIPLDNYKAVATGTILLKIPATYYELNDDTFERSDAKTKNYCVSYTPKIGSGNTSNTPSSSTTSKSTNTQEQEESNPPKVIAVDPDEVDTEQSELEKKVSPPLDTSYKTIQKETTTYNSAGADPSLRSATQVETGPGETMFVFIIAAFLSLGLLSIRREKKEMQ